MDLPGALRLLPSVQQTQLLLDSLAAGLPHALAVREIRSELERERTRILEGSPNRSPLEIATTVADRLHLFATSSLRPVINATGVVLHTNLGRAPLGPFTPLPGYSNLEYDTTTGRRGKRDTHTERLLAALLNRPAIAVNNGAAATFLALHELAAGFEVIVSRGELVEIGDGFRIPDILARSGAILREVGTTNRTSIEDYRDALTARTRLLLRVHPSNFRISGFTAKPALSELAALGKERAIPVYEDLGSGNLLDLRPFGMHEPTVSNSLAAGIDLVSFSGDKLLGGPQAGILAGNPELIARLRRNPLFRAFRLDKLVIQALAGTLQKLVLEDWNSIPALRMIRATADEIRHRASLLFPDAELISGESVIGGGSTPDQSVPTTLIVAARTNSARKEQQLRSSTPPVIGRITDNCLLLDLRTVFPEEEPALRDAVLRL